MSNVIDFSHYKHMREISEIFGAATAKEIMEATAYYFEGLKNNSPESSKYWTSNNEEQK